MRFSGSNDRLRKIAQGIFLRGRVLITAAAGRFPDKTEMHPRPVFHSIGHNGKAFPQIETSDQFVNGVFERIHLLRISVMLSPVCDELFAPVTRKSTEDTVRYKRCPTNP